MIDHTDNDLRAAAKALLDVVAPAIDRENPLALQQLKLVVDWLEFYRGRLSLAEDRDRFELDVQLETARALVAAAPRDATAALNAALSEALALRDSLGPRLRDVRVATNRLGSQISDLVRRSDHFDAQVRGAIEQVIVRDARHLLDAQRAWFLPQSIEPDPGAIPPLDQALRIATPTSS